MIAHFLRNLHRRRHSAPPSLRSKRRATRFEWLEPRYAPAAPILAAITDLVIPAGAPVHVALDGADADGDTLAFTATSSNSTVLPTVTSSGNRSLKIQVDSNGNSIHGTMKLELFEDLAPKTTQRIIQLAQQGFYNGLSFHRVIKGFMIQGGDPTGTGSGGSSVEFDDEYNAALRLTSRGVLAMAKSGDDTNDSQFFVTSAPTRWLDFNHSVFGFMTEGDSVLSAVENVAVTGDRPNQTVTMTKVEVFQDVENGVLRLYAPKGTTGQSDITVQVSDGNGGIATRTFRVTVQADTTVDPPYLASISPIVTTANTPVTVTLPATDVNGNPVYFSAAVDQSIPTSNLTVTANADTGQITVTPKNGAYGVFSILVKAASSKSKLTETSGYSWDSQKVPVYVGPSAPVIASLLPAFDSGSSQSDRITNRDNSSPQKVLGFHLTGLVTGAQVTLRAGNTVIAQTTATATTMDIQTNGTAALPAGTHAITATQILGGQVVKVGNLSTTTDLASAGSTALSITVAGLPAVIDFSKDVAINTTLPLAAADFTAHFNQPADGLQKVKITLLPTHGALKLNGTAVTLNQEIPVADLGKLTYQPNQGYLGADTVKWNGSDMSAYASADATLTINAVPDVPSLTNLSKTISANTALTFTAADFTAHFTDPNSAHTLQKVKITQLPTMGLLRLNGVDVTVNQEIAAADLGKLSYQLAVDYSGPITFQWNGSDGTTYAAAPATVTITVDSSSTLAGRVYLDANDNGQRDSGEMGLPGVVIKLQKKDTQGNWVDIAGVTPVMTAADGSYQFERLGAGTYQVVQVTSPAPFLDGRETAGTAGGTAANDRIHDIVLSGNTTATGYLFGEKGLQPRMVSKRLFLSTTPPPSEWAYYLNQAPQVDLNGSGAANPGIDHSSRFVAGNQPVKITAQPASGAGGATVSDPDQAWLASITATLEGRRNGDAEVLAAVTTSTGVQASYQNGVLSLKGPATVADFQRVLQSITYSNSATAVSTGLRTVSIGAFDGVRFSRPGTAKVAVGATDAALAEIANWASI